MAIDRPEISDPAPETAAQPSEAVDSESPSLTEAHDSKAEEPQMPVTESNAQAEADSDRNEADLQDTEVPVVPEAPIEEVAATQTAEEDVTQQVHQDTASEVLEKADIEPHTEDSGEHAATSEVPQESEAAPEQQADDGSNEGDTTANEPLAQSGDTSKPENISPDADAESPVDGAEAAADTEKGMDKTEADSTGEADAPEEPSSEPPHQPDAGPTETAEAESSPATPVQDIEQAIEQADSPKEDLDLDDVQPNGIDPPNDAEKENGPSNEAEPDDREEAGEGVPQEQTQPPPEDSTTEPQCEASTESENAQVLDETPDTTDEPTADDKGKDDDSGPVEAEDGASGHEPQEVVQEKPEEPHPSLDEEMDEVQPTTPPGELEEAPAAVEDEEALLKDGQGGEPLPVGTEVQPSDVVEEQVVMEAKEAVADQSLEPEPSLQQEPDAGATDNSKQAPIVEGQEHEAQAEADVAPEEESTGGKNTQPLESEEPATIMPNTTEARELEDVPQDAQPQTPPNESALVDESVPEPSPRDKHRRRHSHAHRDSRHSHRRRESNASVNERPTFNSMALFAASKLVGSAKNKRRDSMTDREYGKHKERVQELERGSSSSKERSHREHRSHRHHRDRGDDKESKRRTMVDAEAEVERKQRREARLAEKERLAQEEAARREQEEEERRQKRREERRARRAEEDRLRKAEEERLAREAGERHAREEEERRIRHEKRRQRHEAEKQSKQLEREKLEQREEERRLRRQRPGRSQTEKSGVKAADVVDMEPRDAARRAAEEDDETVPASPITPRTPTRRHTGERRREAPPPARRNSLLGNFSLFGRSKTEPVVPSAKPIKPVARVRTDPAEAPSSPVEVLRKERQDRASSQHSSNQSRERAERPHRSRRHSHAHHRRFDSAEEEAEYRARKEERRRAKANELEMSGARDGGVSLSATFDDAPPPEATEPVVASEQLVDTEERPRSPLLDEAAAVVGVPSISSEDRRERRRTSRRVSIVENDRPKSRRISVTENERRAGRRTESDGPRARGGDEERMRPRRSETERSSRSKRKDDNGIKGFFGGLKKIVT